MFELFKRDKADDTDVVDKIDPEDKRSAPDNDIDMWFKEIISKRESSWSNYRNWFTTIDSYIAGGQPEMRQGTFPKWTRADLRELRRRLDEFEAKQPRLQAA